MKLKSKETAPSKDRDQRASETAATRINPSLTTVRHRRMCFCRSSCPLAPLLGESSLLLGPAGSVLSVAWDTVGRYSARESSTFVVLKAPASTPARSICATARGRGRL